ncbi:MAG: type IV secretion protein Rhs, partial [Silanimonas sp.]|nr:type IV secretion protein Rhs [Silanimonas sp.]
MIPIIGCERTSQRLDCNTEHRLPRVVRIELPDGQGIDYRYDRWGNLARVDYPDGRSRIYHYGEPDLASTANGYLGMHQLTGISDETGRRVMRFGYTPAGSVRLSEVIASDGGTTERTTLRYLSRTEVETTQPEGYSRRYTISDDPYRRITAIAAPNGTQRWTYDANSLLTERRDANDGLTRYEYRNWEPVAVVEAAGTSQERRIETDLHPLWNQPTERRVKNTAGQLLRRETFTYDAKGALLTASVQDPSSPLIQTTTMTRDPDGRILTIDGPRTDVSDITTYTYFDAEDPACASSPTTCSFRKGDLKSVTNALGHTTHFVRYDGAGRLLESRDANGLVSTFTYTPRGWLASRTVGGLTTSITYTAVGDVESVTTPDGRSLTYTYDTARRLTAVQDQRGNRIEWTLDNAGNRTAEAVKDASGTLRRTLTQQFNTLGRLSQAANAAGRATLFTQDANGNLDLASDPLNRTTDQDVDALDRVTRQLQDVAGLNVETQFGFDALDQLTTVTDPKGLITRYTNDGLGNLLKLESPDTGTTTYTVDAAGNRSSQTDARGITVGYTYDALNRLTGIRFPTAALNTTFVYDSATGCPAGETFALGRLSSMTDASGSTR